MELDGGLPLVEVSAEDAVGHAARLVQDFLFAFNTAADVEVRAVLQTLGTQSLQVRQTEQGLVVGRSGRIRPL